MKKVVNPSQFQELQLLLSQKCSAKLTAWNLFEIRANTILSVLAIIATYTIVLVQTETDISEQSQECHMNVTSDE